MRLLTLIFPLLALCARADGPSVRLITLDPGHFHAALVQKSMIPGIDPEVHVYAPAGPDVEEHLKKIESFNHAAANPTAWKETVYRGPDFLDRMLREKAGNVVVISGNNANKAKYILACVKAGLNVLADKPMAITPADNELLDQAFAEAAAHHVLLQDIMTERNEITTMLQRELSRDPGLFGTLEQGTRDNPAVTKESVHHYCKVVAGAQVKRPPWFFDTTQQGEGIVDVTTHLVDLIQWECFPDAVLSDKDVKVLDARHWKTEITPEQFRKATSLDSYPAYLRGSVGAGGSLGVYANGELNYTLRGVHAKVSVIWNFESPGGGDTHYSMMRGTRAGLIIRQQKEQNYKPELYVANTGGAADFEATLRAAVARLAARWPGLGVEKSGAEWHILVPDVFKVGHEAHFGQVTAGYLRCLAGGSLPDWEVPGMQVKYHTISQAWRMSR